MVFHDQSVDIQPQIRKLEENLSYIGYPHHCTHIGPIIRNEHEYRRDTLENRQKILKNMVSFFRHLDVQVATVFIDKKDVSDAVDATGRLSKGISAFIKTHYSFFHQFDKVKVYYDNGQVSCFPDLNRSVRNSCLLGEKHILQCVEEDFACGSEVLMLSPDYIHGCGQLRH